MKCAFSRAVIWSISNCIVLLKSICLKFKFDSAYVHTYAVPRAIPKCARVVPCCTDTCRTSCRPAHWPPLNPGALKRLYYLIEMDPKMPPQKWVRTSINSYKPRYKIITLNNLHVNKLFMIQHHFNVKSFLPKNLNSPRKVNSFDTMRPSKTIVHNKIIRLATTNFWL